MCRHFHLETNIFVAWCWIEQREKTLGERTWEYEGRLRQRWGKNNTMESSNRIDPAYQLQVSLLKQNPDPMVLWISIGGTKWGFLGLCDKVKGI